MCLQAGPAAEGLPAGSAQPGLDRSLLLTAGNAIRMEAGEVVLQVVPAVEAEVTQVAGEGLPACVDEGVSGQTRLVLHHFTTDVTHGAVGLQLHRAHRCIMGVQPDLLPGRSRRVRVHNWGVNKKKLILIKDTS